MVLLSSKIIQQVGILLGKLLIGNVAVGAGGRVRDINKLIFLVLANKLHQARNTILVLTTPDCVVFSIVTNF